MPTAHLCKSTPPLTNNYVKVHLLLHFNIRLIWYDAWTYNNNPIMHNFNITTIIDNVKVHLQLHWLSQQQLHYQVFMSTHSINHNSNKSHQHGSTYININYKTSQQFHILLINQVKWNNITLHDKHHIQPSTIIHISSINHVKPFTKDL
jgi:hypothetical protein